MSNHDIYVFVLCLIVYVMLVSVGLAVIIILTKQTLKITRSGIDDELIKKEYILSEQKRKTGAIIEKIVTMVLFAILMLVFLLSIYINLAKNCFSEKIPTVNIVRTSSMEKKNTKNKYLFENNLNNQISAFDLILTYKKPPAEDIKLYDIVVYMVDDVRIVHRVVGIEEPNDKHPDERWFRLQGDAVETPDRFPVYYSQILGVYRGERVPFIGSFILFMQSPAGWLCIILVLFAIIATPIVEKKLKKERQLRLVVMGLVGATKEEDKEKQEKTDWTKFTFVGKKDKRSFEEKIESCEKAQNYSSIIEEKINEIKNCRMIDGKARTFKSKNLPIAKLVVRGKTLNVYLALNPKDFENTKYKFSDVSNVKKYVNYPMRVKVTSDRQVKWTKELINHLIEKHNLEKGESNV